MKFMRYGMKGINLTNEELARALAEYLLKDGNKKDMLLNKTAEKENFNYLLKLNNVIKGISETYKYEDNKLNISDNYKVNLDKSTIMEQINRTLYLDPTPEEQEKARIKFMQDDTMVLNRRSPSFLKDDVGIILVSISRDINSIVYVSNYTDAVKSAAIVEAKRQGYIFHGDTPTFMLQNEDLIKQSAEKDINTIHLVPQEILSNELKLYIYQLAIKSKYTLSKYSPTFLKSNVEIVKQSLRLDKNSGINVIWKAIEPEGLIDIEKYVVDNQIEFIINFNTPINFKRNINICITSAKNSPDSVRYFDWKFLRKKPEEIERLFLALIEQKYILTDDSPDDLKNSAKICLNSVKLDFHSARFFSQDIHYWMTANLEKFPIKSQEDINTKEMLYEIRHILIGNGYYSLEQISKFPTTLLNDEYILDYYLGQVGILKEVEDGNTKIFYDRIKSFIKVILSSKLTVLNTRKVFHMIAQKQWDEYRKKNDDYYTNIFNRICDSLEQNNNFISALNELKFLIKIDDVLDERKYSLFNAFIEYHQLYHNSHAENKMELLEEKRNNISKNAARV